MVNMFFSQCSTKDLCSVQEAVTVISARKRQMSTIASHSIAIQPNWLLWLLLHPVAGAAPADKTPRQIILIHTSLPEEYSYSPHQRTHVINATLTASVLFAT